MSGDRQLLRQALYRRAASQAGYFTAAQAIDVGYSYQAQKYHIDHGNWSRVDRGIFRLPEWPASVNDSLVRWTLWSKHRAVVSHDSASAVHELGLLNPAKVHLTVPVGFRMSDDQVVLYPRALPDSDVVLFDGLRITTVLRTVIDIAEARFDDELVASVMDDALDSGAIVVGQIKRRIDELSTDARLRVERLLAQRVP